MTDSKLPATKSVTSVTTSEKALSAKPQRAPPVLMGAGLIASVSAIGVYATAHQVLLAAILALVAMGFFGARQLVQKSLAATTEAPSSITSETAEQIEQIRKQVSKCKFLENAETEGTQAAAQADQLLKQYKNLKSLLAQKFETTELTYARYVSAVDASCLAVGENLLHLKSLLENLNITAPSQADLRRQRLEQAQSLLRATDEALRELEALFQALSEITTKEAHRDQLEQSMNHIKELATRAKIYSKS